MSVSEVTSLVGNRVHCTLQSPHLSFAALLAGVTAITQSQQDWIDLFGADVGKRVYVVAKWFAAGCIAITAYGKSVLDGQNK